jgi:hypothetical protein
MGRSQLSAPPAEPIPQRAAGRRRGPSAVDDHPSPKIFSTPQDRSLTFLGRVPDGYTACSAIGNQDALTGWRPRFSDYPKPSRCPSTRMAHPREQARGSNPGQGTRAVARARGLPRARRRAGRLRRLVLAEPRHAAQGVGRSARGAVAGLDPGAKRRGGVHAVGAPGLDGARIGEEHAPAVARPRPGRRGGRGSQQGWRPRLPRHLCPAHRPQPARIPAAPHRPASAGGGPSLPGGEVSATGTFARTGVRQAIAFYALQRPGRVTYTVAVFRSAATPVGRYAPYVAAMLRSLRARPPQV